MLCKLEDTLVQDHDSIRMDFTSCNFVDLMLDKEVNQGDEGPKKGSRKNFTIFNGSGIVWAQSYTTDSPWKRCY